AEDGSLAGLLREICVDPIVPASERAAAKGVGDRLPPGFDAWFARCVDRNVDARYKDAGEAVRAFSELVRGAPMERNFVLKTSAVDPTPAAQLGAAQTALLDATGAAPIGPTGARPDGTGDVAAVSQPTGSNYAAPAKSNVGLYVAAGIAAVALGGGGLYLAQGKSPSGATSASVSAPPSESQVEAKLSASVAAPASSVLPTPVAPADAKCPAGMIFHPSGKTFMGSKSLPEHAGANVEGGGQRKVEVSAFCLDITEVTVRAYEACVKDATCERTPDDVNYPGMRSDEEKKRQLVALCNARKPERQDHPINCISWELADAYCKSKGARLPTETEWEYAARGPVQHDYPWGDEAPDATRLNAAGTEYLKLDASLGGQAKTMYTGDDHWVGTAPVGQFPAGKSGFGVYDLAGNVWEWTSDFYGPHVPGDFKDPKGPATGTERVIRGGAFNGWDPQWANPAWRYRYATGTYSHAVGFRCAADAK
ncbi:MAG: SUMF1/EgtB/PvdO family nonheme iron enzyme, partial [Myxococcales bacterium]|nr:SUMF1/EgtB/PvdO family nonheme iron enzyme [Myxococcales bacterium]